MAEAGGPFEKVPHRGIITACAMVATLMQALDSTIANVALPYMRGGLSASPDQITWVLTSYVVAAAIMTAPVGWLTARFGRKNLFLTSLIGFTIASMLCGIAGSLTEMVLFRFLQGVFGAALVPLSQSTMLDIYPAEQRGSAMALWGMGVMVGPILGPTLGGYLTDFYNWRYVFFVNLPFGIAAVAGLALFLPRAGKRAKMSFDWTGFGLLALGLTALQLMLDRGETKDWFSSSEIITEAVLAALGFYLFLVHMATAKKPFINPRVFFDRNCAAAMAMMFSIGMVLLASSALLAPYLQDLADYPVRTAGLVMAPRGIGTMAAMFLAGRLSNRIDARLMMGFGLGLLLLSLFWMMGWTPVVSQWDIIVTIMVQGAGLGLVFTPLQVVAFATLDQALRTEGAAMLSLFRNVGSAIGISIFEFLLARNTQVEHSVLAGFITPFHRVLQAGGAVTRMLNPATPGGAAMLSGMIDQQSQIIAYMDDYKVMLITSLPAILLLFFMRRAARVAPSPEHSVME